MKIYMPIPTKQPEYLILDKVFRKCDKGYVPVGTNNFLKFIKLDIEKRELSFYINNELYCAYHYDVEAIKYDEEVGSISTVLIKFYDDMDDSYNSAILDYSRD